MPEVITKHPDVVKQVLESAGARCGRGEPQRILTRCPREQFCALPGGEICVFGLDGIPAMTQVSRADLCPARTAAPRPPGSSGASTAGTEASLAIPAALVASFLLRRVRR